MKKPMLIITLTICAAVLCAVLPISAAALDDVQEGRRMAQEEPVIEPEPSIVPGQSTEPEPAAPEEPEVVDEPIESAVPVEAEEDGEGVVSSLTVEEIEGPLISLSKVEVPEPYTMEWAARYAPASVASFEEQVGDNGDYDDIIERPPSDTYRIIVDYTNQCVYAYSRDESGNYTILERVMICTTGGNGDWTPTGEFKMSTDYHRFGYFPSFNCYAQYWTQMFGNFYFHSIIYNARDASTYTMNSYNNLGKPGSHGCIRLFVPDARWIYENCAPGTWGEVTTRYERDEELRNVLRNGYEGCIDYVEGAENI